MLRVRQLFFSFILIGFYISGYAQYDTRYLEANLTFLAHDLLEGREATSRGEQIAGEFIAAELSKYGIQPFGENGTYFQSFPIDVVSASDDSHLKFHSKEVMTFKNGENFIFVKNSTVNPDNMDKPYEIVFAGYGVTAPGLNYDDYANLDVKGKVVLLLGGTPDFEGESKPDPQTLRMMSSSRAKRTTALSNGARGAILLPSGWALQRWPQYVQWGLGEDYIYPEPKSDLTDEESADLFTDVLMHEDMVNSLLSPDGKTVADLMGMMTSKGPEAPFQLSTRISFHYELNTQRKLARNVIGILEGSDKNLKNEYVTIGAHYDHLGVTGEDIYNGADDNGSGTTTVLETARLLSEKPSNRRSVIFAFYSAEEKGLMGAKYYTSHIDYLDQIVSNINIDMVGRESTDSIHVIGADKLSTEYAGIVEKVNEGNKYFTFDYQFNDPDDPNRFYWRSDHVHFASKGIPIVFFFDYMRPDYHRPTDTVEKINFPKMAKVARLAKDITLEVANRDKRLVVDKTFESMR